MANTWLVVGLGNPGPTYALNRHNIGARVIEALASEANAKLSKHKRTQALVAELKIAANQLIVAQPTSFMNESGGPTKALANFYKVSPEHLIVLHDELDIELGAIRIKFAGGDNGHNGLKSIRKSLGTGDWYRVRLGIGRPPGQQDPADFVLRNFASSEQAIVQDLIARGSDAVIQLVSTSLEETQNRFNS
ncbi:MAG: aminoacyl-tRNA hydrolase [Actinobacteria bacterium]|nr:aminoacyl-tRNA hydrolase [Actinomycetota bacterium]